MSLVLNGSTQYAWQTPLAGSAPFTIGIRFKSNNDAVQQTLWAEGKATDTKHHFMFRLNGDAGGDPIYCYVRDTGTAGDAVTTSGYTVDQWHSAMFVEASSQDHRIYIDGGSKGVDVTNDQTPTGLTKMTLGTWARNSTTINFFSGKIAGVAIWDIVLNDAQAADFASGTSPKDIEFGNLIHYWSLLDGAFDNKGSANLTLVGSPNYDADDHPVITRSQTGWPQDRPDNYDSDLYWDEELETWGSGRVTIPGAFAEYLVAVGEEGEVYFGEV